MAKRLPAGKPTYSSPPSRSGGLLGFCLLGMLLLTTTSCRKDYSPKPAAYPRLEYPRIGYTTTRNLPYPIEFDYPSFAGLEVPKNGNPEKKWINVHFDAYRATLLTGYIRADKKDIAQRLVENEALLEKEVTQYTHIRKQEFESEQKDLTGYLYEIEGRTASPVQYILTDKRSQIFRGVLYFDYTPNQDSIRNILDGMTDDIRHLMESFKFKL